MRGTGSIVEDRGAWMRGGLEKWHSAKSPLEKLDESVRHKHRDCNLCLGSWLKASAESLTASELKCGEYGNNCSGFFIFYFFPADKLKKQENEQFQNKFNLRAFFPFFFFSSKWHRPSIVLSGKQIPHLIQKCFIFETMKSRGNEKPIYKLSDTVGWSTHLGNRRAAFPFPLLSIHGDLNLYLWPPSTVH